ncbi:hypothetical protein [Methanobacterium oryzae]|uniref:hypothetical protein n=1 Tax=Methanobacterium oryzae TaxID=69540 RepID=UPI003D1E79B5
MSVLKTKLKKYNKYIVEIEKEEIDEHNLGNIEDIVVMDKQTFENELHKSKEIDSKLHATELELKLKELKIQEKELKVQKAESKLEELEEAYKSKENILEKAYKDQIEELKQLLSKSEIDAEKFKKEYMKRGIDLENETRVLQDKLKEKENLQGQIEIHKITNKSLKNDLAGKEKEIANLKDAHDKLLNLKFKHENEIKTLQTNINNLNNIQMEYNKLENKYRHLQEVANKKDDEIIELEAKKRTLEQYLSMSLEAITTLKNLGLFNRLFKRVPEGIDELQDYIIKLQPPKEIEIDEYEYEDDYEEYDEIEPIRAKSTTDILGEKD